MQTFLGKGLFLSVAPSVLPTVSWTLDKAHFDIVLIRQYFVWDGQLVFMMERYRYASCALMINLEWESLDCVNV